MICTLYTTIIWQRGTPCVNQNTSSCPFLCRVRAFLVDTKVCASVTTPYKSRVSSTGPSHIANCFALRRVIVADRDIGLPFVCLSALSITPIYFFLKKKLLLSVSILSLTVYKGKLNTCTLTSETMTWNI